MPTLHVTANKYVDAYVCTYVGLKRIVILVLEYSGF